MDNHFTRVKSIIHRLRDVLKCQKCLQLKKEDLMLFYLSCDHFYCVDCIGDDKQCFLCGNSLDKPFKVSNDKNILSLYRSLLKFELPSKQEADKIYTNLKSSKEAKTKTKSGEDEVKDSPKVQTPHKKNVQEKTKDKENGKNSVKVIENVTPKPNSKMNTPVSSKISKTSTPVRKGRTELNISAGQTTPGSAGSSKKNTSFGKGNINKRNPKGETQLHLACKKSNFNAIEELIAAGANPNAQDNAGWTPLHESVFSGNLEVMKFLLDHGAKVNAPGLENTTALHEAIAKGNLNMVNLLLEYGADINAMNIFKETPMDLVTKYKLTEMEEILRETANSAKNFNIQTEFKSKDEKIVIYNHDLSIEDEKLVNKFVAKFGAKLITSVTLRDLPTHILVSKTNFEITWAIISCVPSGCWLISIDWVKDSLKDSSIKPSNEYEVSNSHLSGFGRARENKENLLPGLFSGCHFFFGGKFDHYSIKNLTINKENLKTFVEKQGGTMCKRCPDPERSAAEKSVPYHADSKSSVAETCFYIIFQKDKWDPNLKYNMSHMKTLPIDWLISCLCKFQLVDPKDKNNFCDFL